MTEDVNGESLGQKTTRQNSRLLRQGEVTLVDVADRFANHANQMVVGSAVQLHAEWAMVKTYFAENAALAKKMDVFVHSRERNRWDPLPDPDKDFLRARVPVQALENLEKYLPLMRRRNAVSPAQVAKLLFQSMH